MIAEAQSTVFYGQELPVFSIHPSSNYALPQPSLAPAVRLSVAPAASLSIGEAIGRLKAAKTVGNRRKCYIVELDRVLRNFAKGQESRPLSSFTGEEIEAWLVSRKYCTESYLGMLIKIGSLFSFAKKKRWLQANPCEQIERPLIDRKTPFILTPEQCAELLRAVRTRWAADLAYLCLVLFAGIRPGEAAKLRPCDIQGQTIRIDAAGSKVRQPRIIHLHETAIEWLKVSAGNSRLPLNDAKRRRCFRRFRKVLGFESWPQDCLRHTAASNWLALKQDAGWVSMQLGNSPSVLFKHYRQLLTAEQANKFWALMP